jgi:hypothetical protein
MADDLLIEDRLLAFLNKLAATGGRAMYGPADDDFESLSHFQQEYDQILDLSERDFINIIGKPHRESSTAHNFVVRIQLELALLQELSVSL